jgi:aminoglycoside phosphotransferase
MRQTQLRAAVPLQVLEAVDDMQRRITRRIARAPSSDRLLPVIDRASRDERLSAAIQQAERISWSAAEDVILLRSSAPSGGSFIKIACGRNAVERLRREEALLTQLGGLQLTDEEAKQYLPAALASGWLGDWFFLSTSLVAGRPLTATDVDVATWADIGRAALDTLERIGQAWQDYRSTPTPPLPLEDAMQRLRRSLVDSLGERGALLAATEVVLQRVEGAVAAGVEVGLAHGDLWASNLMVEDGRLCGIVDWESAGMGWLGFDPMHLLLYQRKLRMRTSLGGVVREMLETPRWSETETMILGATRTGVTVVDDVLLYWLLAVDANLRRHPALGRSPSWLVRNVTQVLQWV